MERVQRKKRRHKRTAPDGPGEPPQEDKKQDAVEDMEQEAGQMMAGGIQPVAGTSSMWDIQVSGCQLPA